MPLASLAMPFRCAAGAFSRNEEPTLDELLAEPIVHMVMARDRVDEASVREIAAEVRRRSRAKAQERTLVPGASAPPGGR
jgi:hypothetical protein